MSDARSGGARLLVDQLPYEQAGFDAARRLTVPREVVCDKSLVTIDHRA
ncbi:hypothetical protein R6V09_30890 [Streptomyces sp. W16]|nr:hypothetical protein [Streptomyces sp. W16]MDV9174502.1 hypothetical protein [Streptomyces sp. W16]